MILAQQISLLVFHSKGSAVSEKEAESIKQERGRGSSVCREGIPERLT